jgi:tetratricopeptide (TPR) repeat protein
MAEKVSANTSASTETENFEVAEGFIQQMLAPAPPPAEEELQAPQTIGLWRRDIVLGVIFGVLIGFVIYLFVSNNSSSTDTQLREPEKLAASASKDSDPDEDKLLSLRSGLKKNSAKKDKIRSQRKPAQIAKTEQIVKNKKYNRLVNKGWRLYQKGKFLQAARHFGQAINVDSQSTGAFYGLVLSLFENGQEAEAYKLIGRIESKPGPQGSFHLLAGSIYQWRGDQKKARTFYRKYLNKYPRGAFARDVKVLLSRENLPNIHPGKEYDSARKEYDLDNLNSEDNQETEFTEQPLEIQFE